MTFFSPLVSLYFARSCESLRPACPMQFFLLILLPEGVSP